MRFDDRRAALSQFPLKGWWGRTEVCVNEALEKGQSTETLYGGEFKSRQKLHRQIIDEYIELALQHPTESKSVIVGGLPASGKSTYLATHCKDYAVVSPDFFKQVLIDRELVPDIEAITPLETGALCHDESSLIAREFFFELLGLGINVALDFTMNYPESVSKRVKPLKKRGYFTEAILLDIPKNVSQIRVKKRHSTGVSDFLDGEGLGGRYVPLGYIKSSAPVECFHATKGLFDKSYWYNTSGPKPTLVQSW